MVGRPRTVVRLQIPPGGEDIWPGFQRSVFSLVVALLTDLVSGLRYSFRKQLGQGRLP